MSKEIKDLENMRKGLIKFLGVVGTAIFLGIKKSKDNKSEKKK